MASDIRKWKDAGGTDWKVWLRQLNDGDRARLYFTPDPKSSMECPKVLVRGLGHVYQVPERTLPFYLRAAQSGGFVWRDRDGTPWHITVEANIRSESGRRLRVHHPPSHRVLWRMTNEELEQLVSRGIAD